MNLAHSHHAVKGIAIDRIYPALWPGDAALVTFTAHKKRYDARLHFTDGRPVLRPWPGSHYARVFNNKQIRDAVLLAFRRYGMCLTEGASSD